MSLSPVSGTVTTPLRMNGSRLVPPPANVRFRVVVSFTASELARALAELTITNGFAAVPVPVTVMPPPAITEQPQEAPEHPLAIVLSLS
jgi:hypothetical protein